ncbi:MAG: hypothetical protein M3Q75_06725 [Gemmatimonadota bacterium]|nr:hypothetical protein [Gemmatimonadota bacterium]
MGLLFLLLLIAGFVCFVAAAFGTFSRVNLIGLGLAFWILVPLIQALQGV